IICRLPNTLLRGTVTYEVVTSTLVVLRCSGQCSYTLSSVCGSVWPLHDPEPPMRAMWRGYHGCMHVRQADLPDRVDALLKFHPSSMAGCFRKLTASSIHKVPTYFTESHGPRGPRRRVGRHRRGPPHLSGQPALLRQAPRHRGNARGDRLRPVR